MTTNTMVWVTFINEESGESVRDLLDFDLYEVNDEMDSEYLAGIEAVLDWQWNLEPKSDTWYDRYHLGERFINVETGAEYVIDIDVSMHTVRIYEV